MRNKITYTLESQLIDHDGSPIASEKIARKLSGLACHNDSVLNYSEFSFQNECGFRGGHPRLILNDKNKLNMVVEVDSLRKLSRKEVSELKTDFEGQLTDGIGAGCFDELSRETGVTVVLRFPLKATCTQVAGKAWQPKATTATGNANRIAETAKLITKLYDTPTTKSAPKKKAKKQLQSKGTNTKPNWKPLFRLLDKPERNQFYEQIKSEIEAQGNDLSTVEDGEYPYGNFNNPKLLRLLLQAGLPPETTDVKGNSLLIQAAADSKCLELLLKQGANVNRVCANRLAETALIRAANLGKRKSVEVLLQHGADPTLTGKSGKTALDVIDKRSRERGAITELLQSASRK